MRRPGVSRSWIAWIIMLFGLAALLGCGYRGSILDPSYEYGELTVSIRNITPYLARSEWLCRGHAEYATLRDGEGTQFDCQWYNNNAYSNAVLTVFIDAPSGRMVRTHQWAVGQRIWSVSCSIVVVRNYSVETVELQCTE